MQKKRIVLAYFDRWDILRRDPFCFLAGQTTIEATFSMIVIVILMLSMVRVFFWVGNDLASRRAAHEATLVEWTGSQPQERQIRPVFYEGTPMDAAINSEIFGPDRLH